MDNASPESLDQLLTAVDESYGIAVITDNPHRLHTALFSRIRAARTVHPEAYRHISIINSKSPKELYIVNRRSVQEARQAAVPSGDEAPVDGHSG